jgi:hypothetical protein
VKSIRIVILALLACLAFPATVLAVDGTVEEAPDKMLSEMDLSSAISGIVSQSSPIAGYQPLTVAGQEIAATYLEETLGERHGAIIFLHDQGEKLEGNGVITPLRHQMPQYGWSTLTLALDYPFEPAILLSATVENVSEAESAEPVVDEKEAETDKEEKAPLPPISNVQRLDAAIAFLQEKQIDRIIYVGHGAGGNLAVELLDTETTPIQALILVGTPSLKMNDVFKTFQHPILDLYGDNGLEGVAEAVQQRKVIMKRTGNDQYVAREVAGADHFFTGLQTTLVNSLRGWLKVTFIDENNNN